MRTEDEGGAVGRRIGECLAERRKQRGRTQRWVARSLGVTQTRISRWESGRESLPVPAFVAWCDVLRVDACAVLLEAVNDEETRDALLGMRRARMDRPAVWKVVRLLLHESPLATIP